MLPVQVNIVSSASCTLSEAGALLQRFLSSDACSDSFARDYVANVAQSLQDSISRRSGGPESRSKHSVHLHFPAPSESPSRSSNKLFDVKQSILVAGNSTPSPPHSKLRSHGKENSLFTNKLIRCGLGDAHTDEKQSLSSAEDVRQDADVSMEVGSAMSKAEHAFGRHKKKRRHSAVETDLPPAFEMVNTSLMHRDKKRGKKEKHETETEKVGTEDYGPDDQKHHDRKRSKEKQEMETEKVVTEYPALDNQSYHGKKKRKKEKWGKDVEDMETLHVPENRGSPVSLPQAERKGEVSNMDVNNARMSAKVEEFAGSSKRKRKEGKAFRSATPVKDLSLGQKREETDIEDSPLEFENLASEEKKKTKKKRRRKEELCELVRQTRIN